MHVLRYRAPPGGQHNSPAMDGTCGFGALVPSGSSLAGSRVPGRGDLSASLMGPLVALAIPNSKAKPRLGPLRLCFPNVPAFQAAVA